MGRIDLNISDIQRVSGHMNTKRPPRKEGQSRLLRTYFLNACLLAMLKEGHREAVAVRRARGAGPRRLDLAGPAG